MAAITLNPKPKGLHGIGGGQFGVGVLGRAPRARAWISTRLRSPSKIKPKSGSLALSFGVRGLCMDSSSGFTSSEAVSRRSMTRYAAGTCGCGG